MSRVLKALAVIGSMIASSCALAGGTEDSPDCPSGLVVAKQTATSLTVVWNEADRASGYVLYRAISADGIYSIIIQSGALVNQYRDSPLSSLTTYYYKIQAFNSNGSSELSLPATGTTLAVPAGPPETPIGLRVSDPTESSLTLSWNASEGSKGYIVCSSKSSAGPYQKFYDGPLTTATNHALPSKTTIYYKVAAYNANGSSAFSDWVSGTTSARNHIYFGGLVYADNGHECSIFGGAFGSLSAYLTTGTARIPRLNPDDVALAIGRPDVIR